MDIFSIRFFAVWVFGESRNPGFIRGFWLPALCRGDGVSDETVTK
jgi:hypothetical protein